MARRSMDRVAAAARAEEREACIEYLRDRIVEAEAFKRRGRLTAAEHSMLKRRLDAIADGIAAGLHR